MTIAKASSCAQSLVCVFRGRLNGIMLTKFTEIPGVNWTSEALKNEDVLQLIFDNFDLQPGSKTVA